MRVLVTGATGFIGASLLPALMAEGHEVWAGTRRPDRYRGPGQAVRFDSRDPSTLDAALAGCDAAYYLVHGMSEGGDFVERDRKAAEAFGDAAYRHGARIIYLGGLGDQEATATRSAHLVSRHQVGGILRERADTVELQASVVIGHGSIAFEIMRQLVERLPVIICPSWVATRSQPIAVDDMIRYLVAAMDLPARRYQVGGPDVLTYEQMIRRYAELTGRRRRLVKFPVVAPQLSAQGMGLATELLLRVPGASAPWLNVLTDQSLPVSLRLAEGLSVEVVVTDDRIRGLVPFQPMSFDEAVRLTLAVRPAA